MRTILYEVSFNLDGDDHGCVLFTVGQAQPYCPALLNFPMDRFGVQKPGLKALARTPVLPDQKPVAARTRDTTPRSWLGASLRNVADTGEMSALGLPGVTGVLILDVPADCSGTNCCSRFSI